MNPTWTPKEEAFLSDNYLSMSTKELGQKLMKSERSIKSKLKRMGLNRNLRNEWLPFELTILKKPTISDEDVKKLSERHTWNSIEYKRRCFPS